MGYFLPFYNHNIPKNLNFKKTNKKKKKKQKQTNKKSTWRYHFTRVYQKLWLDDVQFLRYGARRIDGRKKWHTEVGASPKIIEYFKQSVALFGMNKKGIVNQVFLSKLWYIGQIYTTPKFIKEKYWKKNSWTLHFEVWTRYFRHKYSINSLELQWI